MADEYKITIQVEGAEVQQTQTQQQEIEKMQQAPQQTPSTTRATNQRTSTLRTIGTTGAMYVGSQAIGYALQQPSRSGNSFQQKRVNSGVELAGKLAIAASSPLAAATIGISMAVEAVTWKLNDDIRKDKENRTLNQALLRAGVSRSGRSRK